MSEVLESQPRLGDLSEDQRNERFARLQQHLVDVWRVMRLNEPGESIVVVPSVAPPPGDNGAVVQAYEKGKQVNTQPTVDDEARKAHASYYRKEPR